MTPQELKNSILQLAIQGKLVEQRAEEGTAEELYVEIQKEKAKLIKEGKIKKDKRIENTDVSLDDMPFDLPDNWKWVTLGSILNKLTDGTHRTPKYSQTGIKFVSVKDMSNGVLSLDNTKFITKEEHQELFSRCNPECGDMLLSKVGTTGVPAIVNTTEEFSLFVSVALLKYNHNYIEEKFFYQLLQSPIVQDQARENTRGVGNKNWVLDAIASTIIPLPPLAEQKRIVAKIEELLPLIDRYEQAWSKLEDFNKRFPTDMQKSILQMAIEGKLVEQRPEEGTGEELYQRIQAEKAALIKAGKIKKEKPLPEIAEDEKPFDIPESWKWVRVSDIAILENGDRSGKYPVEADYVSDGIPFFGAKDIDGKELSFYSVRFISKQKYDELGNGKLKNNDFIVLLRGSVGKSALFISNGKYQTGFICAQMVILRCINPELVMFAQSFMNTPYYQKATEEKVTGTAVHGNQFSRTG